jgi:hypothetical protein
MKYAIIGPKGRINRVTEGEPRYKADDATVVQISDEQAAVVEAGRSSVPPVMYGYKKDKLVNFKEFMEERMAKRKAEREAKQEARKAERKAQREAGEGSKPKPNEK